MKEGTEEEDVIDLLDENNILVARVKKGEEQ